MNSEPPPPPPPPIPPHLPGVPPPPPGVPPKSESLAITALVLGILSVTCLGCFAGVPAIICGHMARGRIERSSGAVGGAGMALAGLIMGYFSLVISIVAILAAIAIPAFSAARQRAQQVQTLNLCRQLTVAIQSYQAEYGHAPMPSTRKDIQVDNALLMDALRGLDKSANPRGVVFFEPPAKNLTGHVLADAWGNAFLIALDGDGDGQTTLTSETVPAPVAIWSCGVNGEDDAGSGDDVASWKDIPRISH